MKVLRQGRGGETSSFILHPSSFILHPSLLPLSAPVLARACHWLVAEPGPCPPAAGHCHPRRPAAADPGAPVLLGTKQTSHRLSDRSRRLRLRRRVARSNARKAHRGRHVSPHHECRRGAGRAAVRRTDRAEPERERVSSALLHSSRRWAYGHLERAARPGRRPRLLGNLVRAVSARTATDPTRL